MHPLVAPDQAHSLAHNKHGLADLQIYFTDCTLHTIRQCNQAFSMFLDSFRMY